MRPSRRDRCVSWIARIRFATQDREDSEGVETTQRSGEGTWERKDTMRATYSFLFKDEVTWFNCLVIK